MINITLPKLKKVINFKNVEEEKMLERAYAYINDLNEEDNIYINTAYVLAKHFGADINTIVSSLIYKKVRQFDLNDNDIICLFNNQVLETVKFLNLFDNELLSHGFNNKLMMIKSITRDVRITIIKLLERLSIMQYIDDEQIEKSNEFIEETLDFYAPIARLIGIYELKNILENLCFRFNPSYNDAKKINNKIREEYNAVIKTIKPIFSSIEVDILSDIKFECNNMSTYDIFLKSLEFEKRIREMNDKEEIESHGFCSIKCLVNTRKQCYEVLYLLHKFKPIMGYCIDYLSGLQGNEYKAIHTYVFINSCLVDFRICTKEMDIVNSYGICSYWDKNLDLQSRLKDNYEFYPYLIDLVKKNDDSSLIKEFQTQILDNQIYQVDNDAVKKRRILKLMKNKL